MDWQIDEFALGPHGGYAFPCNLPIVLSLCKCGFQRGHCALGLRPEIP
jgi:hypothetical protein